MPNAANLFASVIDLETGLSYFSENMEDYRAAVTRFVERLPENRAGLDEMLNAENWKDLRMRLHAIKSGARNIGALEMSATAAKLEKYMKTGEKPLILASVSLLGAECDAVTAALNAFLADNASAAGTDGNGAAVDAENRDTLIEKLRNALHRMNLVEAKRTVAALIAAAGEGEKDAWSGIEDAVSDIDYKTAEDLLDWLVEKP